MDVSVVGGVGTWAYMYPPIEGLWFRIEGLAPLCRGPRRRKPGISLERGRNRTPQAETLILKLQPKQSCKSHF